MNLPVAPFYVMPPDKAAAIKILLYQLTAGWCKVGHSTTMNVKLSKTPPFTNPPNVIGKGPERFAEKIKIRFSWLCSQTGKHRDFKIWRKYSRFQAPGSPYRLDINHEKKFYVSGLHKLCFENYIGGI